LKKKKGSHV